MLIKHQTALLRMAWSDGFVVRDRGGWMVSISRSKSGFSRSPDFDAIRDEFRSYVVECVADLKARIHPGSEAAAWGELPELEVRGIRFATDQSHGDQWRFEFFIVAKKSFQGT